MMIRHTWTLRVGLKPRSEKPTFSGLHSGLMSRSETTEKGVNKSPVGSTG